jgi:ketosteroid isomerase-like protein
MERSAEQEAIRVLESFCAAFAGRDAEALMDLVGGDDLVVVTSEEPLLRGSQEFSEFVERYVDGTITYSWDWDRYDVTIAGPVAWILAQGTETAKGEDRLARHPYRMTMVLERDDDAWAVRQVHGSSPH